MDRLVRLVVFEHGKKIIDEKYSWYDENVRYSYRKEEEFAGGSRKIIKYYEAA